MCRRGVTTITPLTVEEANAVGRAARRVGGYDVLIRLEGERRRLLRKGHKTLRAERVDGRWTMVAKD